jgi:hypothetical protein
LAGRHTRISTLLALTTLLLAGFQCLNAALGVQIYLKKLIF